VTTTPAHALPTPVTPDAAHRRAVLDYATLDPGRVLDTLDRVGVRGDGRVLQLNSYENRVFQVYLEDGAPVVAKFYRPERWSGAQILEEHAFASELLEAEIPAVAPLVLSLASAPSDPVDGQATLHGHPPTLLEWRDAAGTLRCSVSPCRAGRSPELDQPDTLRWIGRFLGRLHAVGARRPFLHRRTLDVATLGEEARHQLLAGGHLPPELQASWAGVCDQALNLARDAFDGVAATPLRLHGDCHRGNVLWTDHGPHFVDLDDAVNGPAVQDLWMLLSGDRSAMTRQLLDLLEGYEDFRPFDWRECRLIEPLRTLRMLHHSAWIARRWDDPAFPAAFPWFGSPAYWSQETQMLRDQIEAMHQPALGSDT
jgi:Ser/Thr protein kinase RdoA (MazF antagonist)